MHEPPPRSLRFALLAAVALLGLACGDGRRRPNVILVTFDTTRADHVSCYGYERETTPNLDRLAEDAVRYTRAYAVSSWTLPAHASLFTGKFPSSHGAMYDEGGAIHLVQEGGIQGPEGWSRFRANPIAADEVTLAQRLGREGGYATGAVIAGPWLRRVFGLDKGFDEYDDRNFETRARVGELNGRPAADVTRAAIDFVDRHAGEPFFLFLNYFDPHDPWLPEPEFARRFWKGPEPNPPTVKFQRAQYDAELAYADHHFGRLLDHLRAKGLYEDSWIVVVGDHGDLIGDQGLYGHGNSLTQPEILVPLIVKEPGAQRPRGTDDTPIQQVDVMPLLLERLALPPPAGMQGSPRPRPGRPVFAEVYPLPFMQAKQDWRQQGSWRALVDGDWKFVWSSRGTHQLYDLGRDPDETQNLVQAHPEVSERMQQALTRFVEGLPAPGAIGDVQQADEETLRLLRGLGYVGGDGEEGGD